MQKAMNDPRDHGHQLPPEPKFGGADVLYDDHKDICPGKPDCMHGEEEESDE